MLGVWFRDMRWAHTLGAVLRAIMGAVLRACSGRTLWGTLRDLLSYLLFIVLKVHTLAGNFSGAI